MHSEKLKKLCCMALTVCLAVSVCGCKTKVDPSQAEAAQAAKEAQQAAENGTSAEAETIEDLYSEAGLTPAAEDDPLWADAEFELPAIAQLLAYKATFADTFNENDPSGPTSSSWPRRRARPWSRSRPSSPACTSSTP